MSCVISLCIDLFIFFVQNSYIGYDVLQKLAIPQPKQYLEVLELMCTFCSRHLYLPIPFKCLSNYLLQARYPDGIALDAVFVHPSVVDMLDTAVGDAIDNGHWY